MNQRVGGKVEFEDGESDLLNELNKKSFTKEMLSSDYYYIKIEKTTPELKNTILQDIKDKFNIQNSSVLDNINFDVYKNENSYTIYSMLFKKFTFITPFDELASSTFKKNDKEITQNIVVNNSNDVQDNNIKYIKYFGINVGSNKNLYNNVDVLFYNNNSDFAVKLKTKEGDEVLLYRTNNSESFNELFNQMQNKTNSYTENKSFAKGDELKVPYIDVDTIINYDELCGKEIKGTNGLYIVNALQNVKFNLNERGGNLISEALTTDDYKNTPQRYFNFDNKFILFLKEENKANPYFALKVDTTDILVKSENN